MNQQIFREIWDYVAYISNSRSFVKFNFIHHGTEVCDTVKAIINFL